VVPQSGTKDQFYCTAYHTTLNSNCEFQGVSKNLKKIVEEGVGSQNQCMGDLSVIFYFLRRKFCLKTTK
jgi:hypothetical protein